MIEETSSAPGRSTFRRSLIINFLSSSGATIVQFIVSVLLARLLTPQEIGVYSIAIVLVNIAHVFRDFGVASYLQRESDLTTEKIRAAMGVAYASTWLIAACIFLSSSQVAAYFGYEGIRPVMKVLAISFLFIPFSSVALSLLLRNYDAASIAWTTAWGTLAYSVTCLGLAYAGFGTMSLAWANLANVMATCIAYIWLRPATMPWLPAFRNVGGIVRFGGGALFANLIKTFNDAVPDLLLGKMGSARQVGLLSRANSTVSIFIYVAGSAMNFGSQTYLAEAFHSRKPLEPLLHRSTALVTGVGWPILAVTSIVASDIIRLLYGNEWVEAAPAIPPLALMAAIGLMFHYNVAAFNAIGRPYLAAFPLTVTAASRVLLAFLLFSGTILSFAWALAAATMVTLPLWLFLQRQYLGCGVLRFLVVLVPSLISSIACAIAAAACLSLFDGYAVHSPFLRILLLAAPITAVWLLSLRVLSHPLSEEVSVLWAKIGHITLPART